MAVRRSYGSAGLGSPVPRTMRRMQSLLFLLIGAAVLIALGIGIGRTARRPTRYVALAVGLVVGLVGTFAVLPVSVDVVPDNLEPLAVAGGILLVSALLALLGPGAGPGPRA